MSGESARSHCFTTLVKDLLDTEPGFIEEYLTGIETYLKAKQKDRILRGEADNLFGNVIIEFESDITRNRAEAEIQLQKYVAIAWSKEDPASRRPYLCIATDGVRFFTYTPATVDQSQQEIAPAEKPCLSDRNQCTSQSLAED